MRGTRSAHTRSVMTPAPQQLLAEVLVRRVRNPGEVRPAADTASRRALRAPSTSATSLKLPVWRRYCGAHIEGRRPGRASRGRRAEDDSAHRTPGVKRPGADRCSLERRRRPGHLHPRRTPPPRIEVRSGARCRPLSHGQPGTRGGPSRCAPRRWDADTAAAHVRDEQTRPAWPVTTPMPAIRWPMRHNSARTCQQLAYVADRAACPAARVTTKSPIKRPVRSANRRRPNARPSRPTGFRDETRPTVS